MRYIRIKSEEARAVNMDARARTIIEGIAERAELARKYVVSGFELWKSMDGIKKFADIPIDVLATYCLYWVSVMKFMNRDFNKLIPFEKKGNIDYGSCLGNVLMWKNIKQSVKHSLIAYPVAVETEGLIVAAKLFDDAQISGPCDTEMEKEISKKACEIAKEKLRSLIDEEDNQLKLHNNINEVTSEIPNCSDNVVKKIIKEVVRTAELEKKHKREAFYLWKDLAKTQSYGNKDIRAQASAAVYGVAIVHFFDRDFGQYANAPESHLRLCQRMAHDWFYSKEIILRSCHNYPQKVSICAIDTALTILSSRVNYMSDDNISITSAALYIAFKKHGFYKKIEELPMVNNTDYYENTKKILEELKEYINLDL